MRKNKIREPKKHRITVPSVIVAGVVGSLLVAFSMTPSFAALTAAITNSDNTAGTGTLVMQEANAGGTILCNSTDGGSVSTNSASCTTINKYGGSLTMTAGASSTTSVTIKNTGTIPATSFTLVPTACSQAANGSVNGTATNMCTLYTINIVSGSTTIYNGTAATFTSSLNLLTLLGTSSVAAGASVPFTFTVTLSSSAGNANQGLLISQPLTWNFGA